MDDDSYAYMMNEARNKLRIAAHYWPENPGTMLITASIPSLSCPVGMLWITFCGNTTIESQSSFVDSRVRRCGVRTAIHNWILQQWPETTKLIANGGTAEGQAWMKATGFKKLNNGDWEFKVKRKCH